jgi:plasmid stabilization system protein ParE
VDPANVTGPYRVILTPRAGADLRGIYDYIAADSPRNAVSVIAKILDALESLKQFPHRTIVDHASVPGKPPVRSLPVLRYVVYFQVWDEHQVVRIVHVRHGARHRPRRFE